MIHGKRHIHKRRFTDGLTVIERFHHRELFGVGFNEVGDFKEDFASFLHARFGPRCKSGARSLNGTVDVGGRRVCALSELFAGRRVCGHKGLAAFGIHPFTVDEKTVTGINQILCHCGTSGQLLVITVSY